MKFHFHIFCALLYATTGFLSGEESRWGVLGDDGKLEATFNDSNDVVLVCLWETHLQHNTAHSEVPLVHYSATVVENYKGELKVGQMITISFVVSEDVLVDSGKFLRWLKRMVRNKERMKFAFLRRRGIACASTLRCMPSYSDDLRGFLANFQDRPKTRKAEQGGADQATTAAGGKAESTEKPNKEAKPRSQ